RCRVASRPHARGGAPGGSAVTSLAVTRRPHARGGAPTTRKGRPCATRSSPRTWGCTARVPGAHEEPDRRPHARGGAPGEDRQAPHHGLRRPHARGGAPTPACHFPAATGVVPTHVGVHR